MWYLYDVGLDHNLTHRHLFLCNFVNMSTFTPLEDLDGSLRGPYSHTVLSGVLYGAGHCAIGLMVYKFGSVMLLAINYDPLSKLITPTTLLAISIMAVIFCAGTVVCLSEWSIQHLDPLSIIAFFVSTLAGLFLTLWGGVGAYATAIGVRKSLRRNRRESERNIDHRRRLENVPNSGRGDHSAHVVIPFEEQSASPVRSEDDGQGLLRYPARVSASAKSPRNQPRRSTRSGGAFREDSSFEQPSD